MSADLFALLAIVVSGFLGASLGGAGKVGGFMALVFATGFVLLCATVGYILEISPAKIMTACGLAFAAWFVAGMFLGKKA